MRMSRWKAEICNKADKLLHEQVLSILDMEFENSEWCEDVYLQSKLPLARGKLGLTHFQSSAPLAYALSTTLAFQQA